MVGDQDKLDISFLRLFNIVDALRASGMKAMGKKNIDLLVNLTWRQERALFVVCNGEETTPEGICLKDLARELKTTIPVTSVLVQGMVRKNLFRREPSPRDRRSRCLLLTPFGRETLDLCKKNIRQVSAELLEGLTQKERTSFAKIIAHFHVRLVERQEELDD